MFPIADVTPVEMAFGVEGHPWMPKYEDIPKEFRHKSNKWNRLFNDLFFSGAASLELTPRDGVDKAKAFRHIKAVMASFGSKHEHKEASVAYLFDQWFTGYVLTPAKAKAR